MSDDARHTNPTCALPAATPLVDALVSLIAAHAVERVKADLDQWVDEKLRQHIAKGDATAAEWLPKTQAAAVAGCAASTVRRWCKAGLLTPGRRGRVNAVQLRQLLAGGAAKGSPGPTDQAAERARRAAAAVKGKG